MSRVPLNNSIQVEQAQGGRGIKIQGTTATGATPYIIIGWRAAYTLAEQLIELIDQKRQETA